MQCLAQSCWTSHKHIIVKTAVLDVACDMEDMHTVLTVFYNVNAVIVLCLDMYVINNATAENMLLFETRF